MNKDIIEGKLKELHGSIKGKWGKLTDDDIKEVEGDFEKLVGKIQARYGQSLEEAKKAANEFLENSNAPK